MRLDKIEIKNFMLLQKPVTVIFDSFREFNTANLIAGDILKNAEIENPNEADDAEILKAISFLIGFLVGEKLTIDEFCSSEAAESGIHKKTMELTYDLTVEGSHLKYQISYDPEAAFLSEKLYIDGQQISERQGDEGSIQTGEGKTLRTKVNAEESFLHRTAVTTGRFPHNPVLNMFVGFINDSYTLEKYGITW